MRTYNDCIPCFFQQALRAGRIATDDEAAIKKLLDEIGMMLKDIAPESTPTETGMMIYEKVREIIGNTDPFKEVKQRSTREALKIYPSLKRMVQESDDSLLSAIRFAIAGNVIDLGPSGTFDIEKEIAEVLQKRFAIFDYKAFKSHLKRCQSVVYIGDNAGETVFDKLLIEQLKKSVIYVVRRIPVINDATREDAIEAGIDKVATIISSGTSAPGTILHTCSNEFVELLNQSEFILAKGQGNYEALSDIDLRIFFLLKVKCQVIADHLGVRKDDIVLKGANV